MRAELVQPSLDALFMLRALELGERARGHTGDNPHVGSLLVRDAEVLGEGWTSPPGLPHAEVNALLACARAGHSPRGATLYCTLEPCSFWGRTPACALTLLNHGITRVVFAIRDPHPRVNGQGAGLLQRGGVTVTEGVAAGEVRFSLRDWLVSFERQMS